MILDFTKLFAISCKLKGLEEFNVELSDIKLFRRDYYTLADSENILSRDLVQIKDEIYFFEPEDNGLIILNSVFSTLQLLEQFLESVPVNNEGVATCLKHWEEHVFKYSPK